MLEEKSVIFDIAQHAQEQPLLWLGEQRFWACVVRGTLSQLQNLLPAFASLSRAQLVYLSPKQNFSA